MWLCKRVRQNLQYCPEPAGIRKLRVSAAPCLCVPSPPKSLKSFALRDTKTRRRRDPKSCRLLYFAAADALIARTAPLIESEK